jgi:tryptophan-rich sensory protein
MKKEWALSDLACLIGPIVVGLGVPALFSAGGGYRPSCRTLTSRLQPPGWVFGVVWTSLYALYGVASFMAWREGGRVMTPALWASVALLAALVAWPVVFFRFCAPELAFAAILAILGLASAVALLFAKQGTYWSAILTAPLVVWLWCASYLSLAAIP